MLPVLATRRVWSSYSPPAIRKTSPSRQLVRRATSRSSAQLPTVASSSSSGFCARFPTEVVEIAHASRTPLVSLSRRPTSASEVVPATLASIWARVRSLAVSLV